jgi:hypothetical protein
VKLITTGLLLLFLSSKDGLTSLSPDKKSTSVECKGIQIAPVLAESDAARQDNEVNWVILLLLNGGGHVQEMW